MTITSRPTTYALVPDAQMSPSIRRPVDMVFCSPNAALYDSAGLAGVPCLSRLPDGTLMIELAGGREDQEAREDGDSDGTPPQRVYEVMQLCHRQLVIIDAEMDVFLMNKKDYDQQLDALPPPQSPNPAIRFEHIVCDDIHDTERCGNVIAGSYFCGDGDSKAEVYINYDDGTAWLWAFGRDSIPLDLFQRTLPNILTLINDPQVQAACTGQSPAPSRSPLERIAAIIDAALAQQHRVYPEQPKTPVFSEEEIEAMIADAQAQQSAQPAPVRDESYEVQVGTIAGCPVTATYWTSSGFVTVAMEWAGKRIMTDGEGLLNLGVPDVSYSSGDMGYTDWGRIKELAQTDVIEQLIALARKLDAESKRKLAA